MSLQPSGFGDLDDERLRKLLQVNAERQRQGVQVDGFRDLQPAGSGGQADVFHARRVVGGEAVAIKILRKGAAPAGSKQRRFARLKVIAEQLRHAHIVPILEEARTRDGRLCVVMPWFPAGHLGDGKTEGLGGRRTPNLPAFARQAWQLASALRHAHRQGILHRDLKPANVLLDDQNALYLTDFGLATQLEEEDQPRQMSFESSMGFRGTLGYAAPEQLTLRQQPSRRSDLYSLGATLYQLLTGVPPHPITENFGELSEAKRRLPERPSRVLASKGVRLGRRDRQLLHSWDRLLLKLLEPHPEDRTFAAEELCADIEQLAIGRQLAPRDRLSLQPMLRWAKRSPALAASLTLLLVSLVWTGARELDRVQRERQLIELLLPADRAAPSWSALTGGRAEDLSQAVDELDAIEQARAFLPNSKSLLIAQARSLTRLGEIRRNQSSTLDALPHFEQALALYQGSIDVDDSPELRGALSVAHVYVGDSLKDLDLHSTRAMQLYQTALALDLDLARAYPELAFTWDNLFWSHLRVGALFRRTGRADLAREQFDLAESAIQRAAKAGAKTSSVVSMQASLLLEKSSLDHLSSDFETWLQVQRQALAHARIVEQERQDDPSKHELAWAHARVARTLFALRDPVAAGLEIEAAREVLDTLLSRNPAHLLARKLRQETELIYVNHLAQSDPVAAACWAREVRDQLRHLLFESPTNQRLRAQYSIVCEILAQAHWLRGEHELARAQILEALRWTQGMKLIEGRHEQVEECLRFFDLQLAALRG